MRRRSAVVMFGDPNGEMYAVRGRRVLPRTRHRWEMWRMKRANCGRRLPEQTAAAEEIRLWLTGLLGERDSITSADFDPVSDALVLTVNQNGRIGKLAFLSLRSWPNVEPRDNLTEAVQEDLRSDNAELDSEFFLSSYAEECFMNRPDPTVHRK